MFYVFTHKPGNTSLSSSDPIQTNELNTPDSVAPPAQSSLAINDSVKVKKQKMNGLRPDSLVEFAKSLIGIPYKYGSTDPSIGFDCSGFITYVFNHFNIKVPRSSKDFENLGIEIPVSKSKEGDLILFTGTDSTERIIGHMGIVVSNDNDSLRFIHSTSGKSYGVVITGFNQYYRGRFVKTICVFN